MGFGNEVISDRDRFYPPILPKIAHQGCLQKVPIFWCCEFYSQHNVSKPSASGLGPFTSLNCTRLPSVLVFIDSIHRFYRFYRFYSRFLKLRYHVNPHPFRPMHPRTPQNFSSRLKYFSELSRLPKLADIKIIYRSRQSKSMIKMF